MKNESKPLGLTKKPDIEVKIVDNDPEVKSVDDDTRWKGFENKLDKLSDDLKKLTQNEGNNQKAFEKIAEISSVKDLVKQIQQDLKNASNGIGYSKSESFWEKLKYTIPKIDFSIIKDEINRNFRNNSTEFNKNLDSTKNDLINNLRKDIEKVDDRISKIKIPTIPTDYLKKDDFNYKLSGRFDALNKDMGNLKESTELLETIPANIKGLDSKLTDLIDRLTNFSANSRSQAIPTNIPKEETVVRELAQYMRDSIDEFENIARYYVSKLPDLEKNDKINADFEKEKNRAVRDSENQAKQQEKKRIAKEIFNKYPTAFNEIRSLFHDFISEKYEVGEVLEINNCNKNDFSHYIEIQGGISLGKYKITKVALLLDDEILSPACAEKEQEDVLVPSNKCEQK